MKLLILAAGKGKRLGSEQSNIPKVLRLAGGRPLIAHVLDAAGFIPKRDVYAVVGFRKEAVMLAYPELQYIVQEECKGTGHAVMCAAEPFRDYEGDLMIVNGDMPLLNRAALAALAKAHTEGGCACTLLSCVAAGEIPPFGHILRDSRGFVADIVEHRDASPEQRIIRELNVGAYVFKAKALFDALKRLEPSAVTGEYYITDLPRLLCEKGLKTAAVALTDETVLMGVNTEADLAAVEAVMAVKGGRED